VSARCTTDLSSALIQKIATIASAGVDGSSFAKKISPPTPSNLNAKHFRLMAAQPATGTQHDAHSHHDRVDVALADMADGFPSRRE